jgi:hypothetical protein
MPTLPIQNVLNLKEAIRAEQLPEQTPRSLAALFASCTRMTLIRADKDGFLVPIRRGGGRTVYYDRANLLRWMGINPGETVKVALAERVVRRKRILDVTIPQERRASEQGRQLVDNVAITKSERASLLQVARLRSRVAKDQVAAFAAKLKADFEKQLDAHTLGQRQDVVRDGEADGEGEARSSGASLCAIANSGPRMERAVFELVLARARQQARKIAKSSCEDWRHRKSTR